MLSRILKLIHCLVFSSLVECFDAESRVQRFVAISKSLHIGCPFEVKGFDLLIGLVLAEIIALALCSTLGFFDFSDYPSFPSFARHYDFHQILLVKTSHHPRASVKIFTAQYLNPVGSLTRYILQAHDKPPLYFGVIFDQFPQPFEMSIVDQWRGF